MTTLIRWDPFREMATLQGEMGRLLGLVGGNGGTQGVWAPAMDAWETDAEFVYAFDLPGISEDDVSVELDDDTLVVSAERVRTHEESTERLYRSERRYGAYKRTIGLPLGVSEGDISARFENGVLEVHVKKPEPTKPRRIQIGTPGAVIEAESTKS
jgi:HSP20 family protein